MERRVYEYVVIGCGGIGSAALYWLSKRAGSGVLGIEQYKLGHDNGGSQDHSRMIRMAYHDDAYTKLTPDAYKTFAIAEEESGIQLLYKTGGLLIAKKGEKEFVAKRYADSMTKHNIQHEWLTGSELREKYPQFTTDDSYVAVYQKDGGLVDAAMANAVHIQLARGNGASTIENCSVTKLERNKSGAITIHTTKGEIECKKVVVTAGSWTNHVTSSIGVNIPIYVTQEQVTYVGTSQMKDYVKDRFPIVIYHTKTNDFYAMPIHGNTGFKVGIDAGGPVVTAESRTFTPDPAREEKCINYIKEIFPTGNGPILYTKTCLYDMPPDRNFVVDTAHRTGFDDVIICVGAGHGYKFAGLFGKMLSEMAIDGKTQYDISSFTLDREALTDPNYKSTFILGTAEKSEDKKSSSDEKKA